MGKMDPCQQVMFTRELIAKEMHYNAKDEAANAKTTTTTGGKPKEPHWLHHVEPPPFLTPKEQDGAPPAASEAFKPGTSIAGSKSGSIAASDAARGKKLGEWKVDFEDTGSQASGTRSGASHPSKAHKQSRAGTAATSDTEIVARLMKLELDLKSEKQRREAAEAEMKEITKAMSSRPAVVTAKPT